MTINQLVEFARSHGLPCMFDHNNYSFATTDKPLRYLRLDHAPLDPSFDQDVLRVVTVAVQYDWMSPEADGSNRENSGPVISCEDVDVEYLDLNCEGVADVWRWMVASFIERDNRKWAPSAPVSVKVSHTFDATDIRAIRAHFDDSDTPIAELLEQFVDAAVEMAVEGVQNV